MPARSGITPARRLAGTALARIIGVKAAARTIGVDPRSVASWLSASADADHDADAWRAAEMLAQERMLSGLATGDPRGLAAWATAAGISSRNVRYATLIARREGRKREEPKPSWAAAWQALSMDRRRLLIDTIRYRREHPPTDETAADGPELSTDQLIAAGIALIAKMTGREVVREASRLARKFVLAEGRRKPAENVALQQSWTPAEASEPVSGHSDASPALPPTVTPGPGRRDLLRLIRQRPEEPPDEPHPLHRKGRGRWHPFGSAGDDYSGQYSSIEDDW